MITAGAEIQVLVATRPVDFRNYAQPVIMRSLLAIVATARDFSTA
jgi:hypothetical protein